MAVEDVFSFAARSADSSGNALEGWIGMAFDDSLAERIRKALDGPMAWFAIVRRT